MQPPKARDGWLDNAKIAILGLVVLGHLLTQYRADSRPVLYLYNAIFLFHIPAIVFLAGYFSRPLLGIGYFAKALRKSLLPYLIFQVIFLVFFALLDARWPRIQFWTSAWGLWFLLCLFYWTVALPVVLRIPMILPLSVAVAVAIGYFPQVNTGLSLSRAFVFFPFFIAGYLAKPKWMAKIRDIPWPMAVVLLASAIICATQMLPSATLSKLLYGRSGYASLKLMTDWAGLYRFGHLVLAAVASVGFLALVPKASGRFSALGQQTIYIYLFHLLLVRAAQSIGFFPATFGVLAILAMAFIWLISIWAFTRPGFIRPMRPLVEGTILTSLRQRFWVERQHP